VKPAGFSVTEQLGVTALPRPTLGFGRQLGRKMSLIATDRPAPSPDFVPPQF
jgi:hypothetical protein